MALGNSTKLSGWRKSRKSSDVTDNRAFLEMQEAILKVKEPNVLQKLLKNKALTVGIVATKTGRGCHRRGVSGR